MTPNFRLEHFLYFMTWKLKRHFYCCVLSKTAFFFGPKSYLYFSKKCYWKLRRHFYFYVSPKDCIFDDSFCRKSYLYFSKESYSCEKWMETIVFFFSFSFRGNISLLKFFVKEIKENSLSNPKRFTERKRCSNFYEIRYGALVLH
jgi:hypothetical protein